MLDTYKSIFATRPLSLELLPGWRASWKHPSGDCVYLISNWQPVSNVCDDYMLYTDISLCFLYFTRWLLFISQILFILLFKRTPWRRLSELKHIGVSSELLCPWDGCRSLWILFSIQIMYLHFVWTCIHMLFFFTCYIINSFGFYHISVVYWGLTKSGL